MKKSIGKLLLYFILLNNVGVQAQNNLFEKVYQKDHEDFKCKFLKRDSVGFAIFTESIGVNNGLYFSTNTIFSCNDTGYVTQQISLDATIPLGEERYDILDWYVAADGNYIVNYYGSGCDYTFYDSCHIFKLSPAGNLIWSTFGLPNSDGKTGMLQYLNGYLNYNLASIYAPNAQNVKLMFCNENGNRRPIAEFANNYYIDLYSNNSSLFAITQDTSGDEYIRHIDTSGTIYQSYLVGISSDFTTQRAFASQLNKIAQSFNNTLYLFNDTLALIQQKNLTSNIIKLQFDALGNIWALLDDGNLTSLDASLNLLSNTNLQTTTGNINTVNWFDIDISKNRIYFGGFATHKPFLKSMELSTFNHFQNTNDIQVTSTQITNAIGYVIYLQPTAPVYRFDYQFDVDATIKNTGNTIVQSVFLNCSNQLGNYICNKPYLSKQFNNLNLSPGDSITLNIGNYLDINLYIPITTPLNPYTRSNFCVWPSAPNDTWIHNTIPTHCQDVEITNVIGVGINHLAELNAAINLSPNPGSDKLLITLPTNYKPTEISIIDITGAQLVKYFNSETASINIDISSLNNGIYFLHLSDGENLVRKKFVKSN